MGTFIAVSSSRDFWWCLATLDLGARSQVWKGTMPAALLCGWMYDCHTARKQRTAGLRGWKMLGWAHRIFLMSVFIMKIGWYWYAHWGGIMLVKWWYNYPPKQLGSREKLPNLFSTWLSEYLFSTWAFFFVKSRPNMDSRSRILLWFGVIFSSWSPEFGKPQKNPHFWIDIWWIKTYPWIKNQLLNCMICFFCIKSIRIKQIL